MPKNSPISNMAPHSQNWKKKNNLWGSITGPPPTGCLAQCRWSSGPPCRVGCCSETGHSCGLRKPGCLFAKPTERGMLPGLSGPYHIAPQKTSHWVHFHTSCCILVHLPLVSPWAGGGALFPRSKLTNSLFFENTPCTPFARLIRPPIKNHLTLVETD